MSSLSNINPAFPPEIMYRVFDQFHDDQSMLFKLLLVGPDYLQTVERLLYCRVCDWIYFPGPRMQRKFLDTITNNPRLASYVNSYAIIEIPRNLDPTDSDDRSTGALTDTWEKAVQAIQMMPNLNEFILQVLPMFKSVEDYMYPSLLNALKPKQLVSLKWNAVTPHFYPFLTTQRHLRNLSIQTIDTDIQLPETTINTDKDLPNLQQLSGNAEAIKALVPGNRHRRLEALTSDNNCYIHINNHNSTQQENGLSYVHPLENLETLVLQKNAIPSTALTKFRNLRCLQVEFSLENVQEIERGALPLLECIVFTGVKSIEVIDDMVLTSLTSTNPSLHVVYAGPLKDESPRIRQPSNRGQRNNVATNHYHTANLNNGGLGPNQIVAPAALQSLQAFMGGTNTLITSSNVIIHNVYNQPITSMTHVHHPPPPGSMTFYNSPYNQRTRRTTTTSWSTTTTSGHNATNETNEEKLKIDYPDINTRRLTAKYGRWKVGKGSEKELQTIGPDVVAVKRTVFSDDLFQMLRESDYSLIRDFFRAC